MSTPFSAFVDRFAFSVGEVDLLWVDVAMAAMAHGDWSTFERRLAEGLACAARADAEHMSPGEQLIDEAAIAFRYARDLIAGEDLTAWLDGAGLSTAEWMAWVRRDVLRLTWATETEETLDRFAPSPRQLDAAAVTEGLCSGLFEAFERSFAGRVAAVCEADGTLRPPDDIDLRPLDAEADRLARQHAHWLMTRPTADTRDRLRRVLYLEECFGRVAERLASPESLRDIVEASRRDWVLLELDTIVFAKEGPAREAMLCVREDGLSLHDVAALSRHIVTRSHAFLEDVPGEHQNLLLSASSGQTLGPLATGGGFAVMTVVGRVVPTLDDHRVVQRAHRAAVDHACRRASRDLVKRRTTV